jgi:glycosidase
MRRLVFLLAALLMALAQSAAQRPTSTRPASTVAEAWYANAVFYQVLVRSFQDSDGDGIGDFRGLTSRLPDLRALGVTALYLMPVHPSPSYHGYDVTDYTAINPQYGTMADFDAFLIEAKKLGFRVILDWVPNHTSTQHPWFVESRNPTSSKRNWYIWRDTNPGWGRPWGQGDPSWYAVTAGGGVNPSLKVVFPGTIQAALGAQAWNPNGTETRALEVSPGVFELVVALPRGRYEYKVALNGSWSENYGKGNQRDGSNITLEVPVDGSIVKFVFDNNQKRVLDSINNPTEVQAPTSVPPRPRFDDAGTLSRTNYYYGAFWEGMPDLNYRNPDVEAAMNEAAKFWLVKGVDGFRLDAIRYMIEEADNNQPDNPETLDWMRRFALFVRSVKPEAVTVGEVLTSTATVGQYFLNGQGMDIGFNFDLRKAINEAVQSGRRSSVDQVLANVARFYPARAVDGVLVANHDFLRPRYLGSVRYRVAASLLFTLPGTPFVYYGDEIGMPNGPSTDDRDKRTPMPWNASKTGGFTTGTPWHGFSADPASLNVQTQRDSSTSLWTHYRNLIRVRQGIPALRAGGFEPVAAGDRVMAFVRRLADQAVIVALNLDSLDGARVNLDLRGTSLEQASGTVRELTLGKTLVPKAVGDGTYPVTLSPGGLVILEIR